MTNDEINSNTTEETTIFEHGEEIRIRFDHKKSMETAGGKVTFKFEDKKVIFDDNKSVQTQRNDNLILNIFEKWTVKIFPPLKLNFLKLSNYSEDENISNEDTYARLIIILFFITVVLCFITFGQIIWISDLSRGPIVVQPFIPKINNPFCK